MPILGPLSRSNLLPSSSPMLVARSVRMEVVGDGGSLRIYLKEGLTRTYLPSRFFISRYSCVAEHK